MTITTAITASKKPLGRGLSVLFGEADLDMDGFNDGTAQGERIQQILTEQIIANKDQPRREFDFDALNGLADSIKEKGVLQPILVREKIVKERIFYEIIAGERRWRAARIAQIKTMPAIIKSYNDQETLEIALVENIQRADLDPVDEALAYQYLMQHYSYTQEKLAESMGKNRSSIAHILRFLKLDEAVQKALRERKITAGHAKLLLGVENAASLCLEMIEKKLTVRAAEVLIASAKKTATKKHKIQYFDRRALEHSKPIIENLKARIGSHFTAKQFKCSLNSEGASLQIKMNTLEELEIFSALLK